MFGGSSKERQLLRRGGQTKRLEMPVTVLPNVKNEQLLFAMLDFRPCKRCNDQRKLITQRSDIVAARSVLVKYEIKISVSNILRIIINSVSL
jgi:hypothetical protein